MVSRILIIDDDESLLEIFNLVLEEDGYEIHLSSSVFEDLMDIEQLKPDLIILDFMIGSHQDGWQFLQKLKRSPSTLSIPVLLCTGAIQKVQQHTDYLQEHNVSVLDKPFDIEQLLQRVGTLLLPSSSVVIR